MKLLARRGRQRANAGDVVGTARVDRSTAQLVRRLKPGEVAVIDHQDLDRASAERLVACRPAGVVNAAASTSGRYPNLGPQVLVAAGIPLVDRAGPAVLRDLADGVRVRLDGGAVLAASRTGERVVAQGVLASPESVVADAAAARTGMVTQLESFAADAADHLRRERGLLLEGAGVPELRTRIAGRHVLVVTAGEAGAAQLRSLRPYLREHRPVLLGAGGGADLVLAAGHRLDLALGGLDELSDPVLASGAEIVVRLDPQGSRRVDRVRERGVDPVLWVTAGSVDDLALLLADERGAALVVAAGARASLLDLLDSGRAGMAGTVLARIRVGDSMVDAAAVARLVRPRITGAQLLALLLAGLIALAAAMASTPAGASSLAGLGSALHAAVANVGPGSGQGTGGGSPP